MKRNRKAIFSASILSVLTIALLAGMSLFAGDNLANVAGGSALTSDTDVSKSDIMTAEIPDDLGAPKVVITTEKSIGSDFTFRLNLSGRNVYIDWGDGVIVEGDSRTLSSFYEYDETLKGNTVKIYTKEDITDVYVTNQPVSAIDVSRCPNLDYLMCNFTGLPEIDLSANTALTFLRLDGCNLTNIDLSKNTAIYNLSVRGNQLTSLDLSSNTALRFFDCGYNNFSALDLSNNTALIELMCEYNNLSELDLSNNTELTFVGCDNNNLKFSTISLNVPSIVGGYAPQAKITIPTSINTSETIDLSSEYNINGTNTVYTWYEKADASSSEAIAISADTVVTPTKSENGIFTFGEEFDGKTLYCTMTNTEFPDLTLQTTDVLVDVNKVTTTTTTTTTTTVKPGEDAGNTGNKGNSPGTGESNLATTIAVSLLLLSLAVAGAVVYKKKLITSFDK